ncbi:MAG: hypothetical protein K6T83_21270, partial [Alicyclobacillus sp.]|nr:hypothetical protein [Alicyclobacillus sp.]
IRTLSPMVQLGATRSFSLLMVWDVVWCFLAYMTAQYLFAGIPGEFLMNGSAPFTRSKLAQWLLSAIPGIVVTMLWMRIHGGGITVGLIEFLICTTAIYFVLHHWIRRRDLARTMDA